MHENLYFKVPEIKLPDEFFTKTEIVADVASDQMLDFINTGDGQRGRLMQTSDIYSTWHVGLLERILQSG